MDPMKFVLGLMLVLWLPAPTTYGVVQQHQVEEASSVKVYPSAEIRVYMEVQTRRIQNILRSATGSETVEVFESITTDAEQMTFLKGSQS